MLRRVLLVEHPECVVPCKGDADDGQTDQPEDGLHQLATEIDLWPRLNQVPGQHADQQRCDVLEGVAVVLVEGPIDRR